MCLTCLSYNSGVYNIIVVTSIIRVRPCSLVMTLVQVLQVQSKAVVL